MHGVEAGICQQQRIGIGQPDILRGQNYQPSSDESRLLATRQHTGQVVDRRIGIATSHRLDEGRDHVVVLLAIFVVEGDVLLQAVGYGLVVDHDRILQCARNDV